MYKLLVKDNDINKQYTCSSYYGPFMRAINVEVSEVLKKLEFTAQIDLLQLFGEICRQKGYM